MLGPVYHISLPVRRHDFSMAGEGAARIKQILRQLGVPSDVVRRAAVAAYEAEMNIVIHSCGGILGLHVDKTSILVTADDLGPGIPDVELAMKEGYSTASDEVREMGFGAGMGLPNIRRCSDEFAIESIPGEGTHLKALICIPRKER